MTRLLQNEKKISAAGSGARPAGRACHRDAEPALAERRGNSSNRRAVRGQCDHARLKKDT